LLQQLRHSTANRQIKQTARYLLSENLLYQAASRKRTKKFYLLKLRSHKPSE